ncbi:MAG: hypothetical protein JWM31_597, partial [Solirubrobacterales bacterium]|nr:hypothetical protein [Solirubrobacterales bacterium]
MVGSRGRALVGSLVASALVLGSAAPAAPAASAQDGPICRSNARCDFSQDGVVDVPEGVRSLTIVAVGAPGAGSRLSLVNRPPNARCLQNPSCARLLAPGGRGARVEATTPVVPNQRLYVHLGRPGLASEQGAPGGGATWVSATPEEPRPGADARVVTAGGGGGSSTADFGDKIAGSPGGDAGEPGSPQPFLLGAFGVADDARAGLGGGPGTTHAGGKAGRSTATLGGQPPQAGGFVAGAPSRAYSGGGGDGIYGGGAGGVGFDGRFSAPGGSAGGGGGASGVANGVTLVSLGRATTAPSASIVFTGRPATSNLDKDSFELSIGGEVVARATQQTTYRPAAATRTDEISLLLVGVTPVGPRLAEYAKLAPTDRAATVLRGGVMRITNPTRPTVLLCLSGLHRPSVGNHSAVTGGYDVVSFGFERSEPCSKAVTPVPGLTAEMLPNGGRPRDVLRIACLRPGGCNGVVRATQGELHQPVVFRLAANRQVTKTLDGFTETPVLTVSESGYEPEDGRKITQGPISAKSQVKTARTTAMVQARTGGDGWVKALALATTPMSSGPSTPLPQILAPGASEPPPPFDPGTLPLPTLSLGCPATAIAGAAVRITGSTSTPL